MTNSSTNSPKLLWTYLFLVYAAAILLLPVIFTKQASFCIKQDNLHQAYPFYNKLSSSLHKGYLPVWDANTYGGKNFSGELQTGIFYPVNVIWCLLFGSAKGINVYYVDLLVSLHFLICLIGMFRLATAFRLPSAGAVTAALIFTFTSAVAARAGGQTCIFFGLTLLPWVIYFLVKHYQTPRHKKWLFFTGLIAGCQILAGHMQPFFHTLLLSGILILFFEYRDRRNWTNFFLSIIGKLALILCFALLISLPQDYYAAEYLSHCYRSVGGGAMIGPGQKVPWAIYAYHFMIEPANAGNLLGQGYAQPDDDNLLYMGILPLLLIILYIGRHKSLRLIREHAELTKILLIILAIGICCVLGYRTFVAAILYKIPLVNVVRQLGRYIILISFSCSLLAGLAITYLPALKKRAFRDPVKIKFYLLVALCLNCGYLALFHQKDIPLAVSIPFLLTFGFFLTLTRVKAVKWLPALAIAVICVDLYLNPVSYLPTRTPYYPAYFYGRNRIVDSLETTYGRYRVDFAMKDYSLVPRNLGDMYAIQTKFGYGATVNKSYLDFINTDWSENSEVNDLLNVKYLVSDARLDSSFIFRDSTRGLYLYERRNCYPRVYWKHQLGMQGADIEKQNTGKIQTLAYSDLYQKFAVDCATPDTLIFSENVYPGWACADNQKNTAIYPAKIKNYPPLFRSIALGPGHHIVEFTYHKVFYWF